jgi:tetratricopeptide (TPR) repeat protein
MLINAFLTVADLQHRQGKLAEAETQFRQALELRRARPGEEGLDSFYMMNSLAGLLLDKGHLDGAALLEADTLCQAALAGRQKRLPSTHTSLAASLSAHARILLVKGQPEAAEPYLRDAIKIYEGSPRANDWELFHARTLLGACHVAAGRFDEAEPLLVEGCTALENQLACPPQRRRQALERVIALYKAWDKPEKVAEWEKRLK